LNKLKCAILKKSGYGTDDGLITGRDRDFPCTGLDGPPVKGP